MTTHAERHPHRMGEFRNAAVRSAMMSEVLAQNWWAIGLRGLAAVLFGAAVLLLPGAALLVFVIMFAAYALFDGVFAIVAALRAARRHDRWSLLVLQGVADIAAAAIALALPLIALLGLAILLAAWSLVTGGLELAAAFLLKIDHGRVWMIVGGAASLVLGVMLILTPLFGALVLAVWVGAYAIVSGLALCALAFKLRLRAGGWELHRAGA
jgi:uncharacterized membrane protein HdeD (DUF308 family)